MDFKKTRSLIKEHEGLRLKPYKCSAGKLTVGYGRNLDDKGITGEEALLLLENDISECIKDLKVIFPEQFQKLQSDIQMVLTDMRFQLGPYRFRGFKKMIRAVQGGDLPEMIKQMKDSKWYGQTPSRANGLIEIVTGL